MRLLMLLLIRLIMVLLHSWPNQTTPALSRDKTRKGPSTLKKYRGSQPGISIAERRVSTCRCGNLCGTVAVWYPLKDILNGRSLRLTKYRISSTPRTRAWDDWLNPEKEWSNSLVETCLETHKSIAYLDLTWHTVNKSVGNPGFNSEEAIKEVKNSPQKTISLFFQSAKRPISDGSPQKRIKRDEANVKEEASVKKEDNSVKRENSVENEVSVKKEDSVEKEENGIESEKEDIKKGQQ